MLKGNSELLYVGHSYDIQEHRLRKRTPKVAFFVKVVPDFKIKDSKVKTNEVKLTSICRKFGWDWKNVDQRTTNTQTAVQMQ